MVKYGQLAHRGAIASPLPPCAISGQYPLLCPRPGYTRRFQGAVKPYPSTMSRKRGHKAWKTPGIRMGCTLRYANNIGTALRGDSLTNLGLCSNQREIFTCSFVRC